MPDSFPLWQFLFWLCLSFIGCVVAWWHGYRTANDDNDEIDQELEQLFKEAKKDVR